MFRKPRNILEALRARQYGYPNGLFEPIFRETCEHQMTCKTNLQHWTVQCVRFEDSPEQIINLVVSSPDGKRAACVHNWYNINVINLLEGKSEKFLRVEGLSGICSVTWSPLSKGTDYVIAAIYNSRQIYIWFSGGKPECSYRVDVHHAYAISFHPTKLLLAVAAGTDLVYWDIENKGVRSVPCSDLENLIYARYAPTGKSLVIGIENEIYESCFISQLDLLDDVEVGGFHNSKLILRHVYDLNIAINDEHTMMAAYELIDTNCDDIKRFVIVVSLRKNNFGSKLYRLSVTQAPGPISFSPSSKYLMFKNNHNDVSCLTFVDINKKVIQHLGNGLVISVLHKFVWSPNIDVGVVIYNANACGFIR